jgi:hypothetical protein
MTSTRPVLTPSQRQRWAISGPEVLFLAFIFCAGFFGYLMPALGYFTMIPGDLGDARFNSVILEHVYQWLSGHTLDLWSPSFFYPFERVLGLSDNHFGSILPYAFLRWVDLTREMAYSGWFLVGTVLNFWVCWWVLTRAGFMVVAAGAGAFVFAFALPMLHQEGHAQMVYRFAIPLAMFAWYRALERQDLRALAQTVFWCGVQFLCSIYLGVFLVYALIACLVAHYAMRMVVGSSARPRAYWLVPKQRLELWLWLSLALGVSVAVALLLCQYQRISSDYGLVRALEDLRPMIPSPSSYLLADNSPLSRWVGASVGAFAARSEHQLFVGLGVLFFAGLGLGAACYARRMVRPLRVCAGVAGLTLALLITLTLMVGDFSFYVWVLKLPGVDAIRAVSRIILVLLLPIAVLVAFGFEYLLQSLRGRVVKLIVLLLALCALVAETVWYQPHHAAVQTWLDRQAGMNFAIKTALPSDAILYVSQRKSEPFYITELDAMIYAQDHYLRTLNGYSGSTPPGYAYPDPCVPANTRLKGYFVIRNLPEARQQMLLSQLKTVALEPCTKN